MNRLRSLNFTRGWRIVALTATAAIIASTIIVARADGGKTGQPKALTGADLYQRNCALCHAERYPREHTDAQWKTIMLQMRVRAQLPGKVARKILNYLQENN